MSIKQQKEIYVHIDINNIILELKESYLENTVTAAVVDVLENVIRPISILEIGQKYIQLMDIVNLNERVLIKYKVNSIDYSEDVNILDRLNKLEIQVNNQNKIIETLVLAMNNRVDKHTFNVWLKAVEHRFGKPILEDNLAGIQAVRIGDLD